MSSDEWGRYVRYVIGDDDQTTAGARVGVSQTTVGRWLKGKVPDAAHVAALAEEYDRDVLEAFVAAGLLTVNQAPSLSGESRQMLADLFSGEQPGDPPGETGGRRRA